MNPTPAPLRTTTAVPLRSSLAEFAERCAQLFREQLRFFPGGEKTVSFGFAEVDQVVVGPFCPAIEDRLRQPTGCEHTLVFWRRESVSAALRFLDAAPSGISACAHRSG